MLFCFRLNFRMWIRKSFWLAQTLTERETKETVTYHKLHLTLPVPIIRPLWLLVAFDWKKFGLIPHWPCRTPPYDQPLYMTTSLSFDPNERNTGYFIILKIPLIRPGFYGPTVVALTVLHRPARIDPLRGGKKRNVSISCYSKKKEFEKKLQFKK